MAEQDDLFNKNIDLEKAEDLSVTGDTATDSAVPDPLSAAGDGTSPDQIALSTKGQESPLEVDGDIAGSGIATGEVRAVAPPPRAAASNLLLLVMVLVVALFGVAYYFISGGLSSQAPPLNQVQRQQTPERHVIDKQVEVEVVEQQQIVTVEAQPAPVAKKTEAAATQVVSTVEQTKQKAVAVAQPLVATATDTAQVTPLYQVLVGPFLSKAAVATASTQLHDLGFAAQPIKGRGMVTMTRLLEGLYPRDVAQDRLTQLKKRIGDAFMLPAGDNWAIYVGSFHDSERAGKYVEMLAAKDVTVTQVSSDVEMNGKMLIASQTDQQTARQIAERIANSGLKTQVVRK